MTTNTTTTAPYFAEGTEAMLALERMVDAVGTRNVVFALAHIASAKAEHLRSNWQDNVAAAPFTSQRTQHTMTTNNQHSNAVAEGARHYREWLTDLEDYYRYCDALEAQEALRAMGIHVITATE